MIKSMTAYARAENQASPFTVRVEVRSYNSRHLDVDVVFWGDPEKPKNHFVGVSNIQIQRYLCLLHKRYHIGIYRNNSSQRSR